MFTLQPRNGSLGSYRPSLTEKLRTPARVWWSSTVVATGWSNLRLAEDPASVPPQMRENDSTEPPNSEVSNRVPDTVLLVEDNPTDIFVIKKILAESGVKLHVHVAKDGQAALRYLREILRDKSALCPALVLLDLNVPKIGGLDVLREMRASQRCNRTPVIVVTSSGAEEDRTAAQALRAEGYFQKPTSLAGYAELGQLVRHVLDAGNEPRDS